MLPYSLPARLDAHVYEMFLKIVLPDLFEDVPLNICRELAFQHDGAPAHFGLYKCTFSKSRHWETMSYSFARTFTRYDSNWFLYLGSLNHCGHRRWVKGSNYSYCWWHLWSSADISKNSLVNTLRHALLATVILNIFCQTVL